MVSNLCILLRRILFATFEQLWAIDTIYAMISSTILLPNNSSSHNNVYCHPFGSVRT